jgi:hypothetical protein
MGYLVLPELLGSAEVPSIRASFCARIDSLGSMITTYPLQSLLSEAELQMGQT